MKDEMVIAKFANTTKHGAIKGKSQTHMIDDYKYPCLLIDFIFLTIY